MAPRQASAVADPTDWETVQPDDWQTVTPASVPRGTLPPNTGQDAWQAGVHGNMLKIDPGTAYQNRDEIDTQLRSIGGDYDSMDLDPTIENDVKVGWEESIFGLHHREAMPEEIRNPGLLDKFVSGVTEMVADLPFYIAGGLAGGAAGGAAGSEVPIAGNITGAGLGAAAGGFALPAALREVLVQGIKNGDVKDFPDLLRRAGAVTWAATKGAVTGAATELAGGLPVGKLAGPAATAVKGLYQATALTTAADLLDGKLPSAQDFAGNAALIIPLNLIAHGLPLRKGEAQQATMDVYAKDGTTPEETATRLAAQPPVKPDAPPGLRPAIEVQHGFGAGFIEGDEDESHADVAERVLAKKPVSLEQLEADPTKADDVLDNPAIHEQEVIDKAWELKSQAIESGDVPRGTSEEGEEKPLSINDLYDRSAMKSGRGFVTPDGKFLSRMEARKWMKDNEPDTHELWLQEQDGDKQAELHAEDYQAARQRAQARSLAEGDPTIANVAPQNAQRLAAAREGLNKIKAGLASKGYGREVLRTLFAGQRDTRIAATTQLRDEIKRLIPDYRDQEALSILRDYKGTPDKLAADLEQIRNGDSERLKGLIPSIERAINPSPELLEADQRLTAYYTAALDEGRQLGFMESSIDPSHYSPHILTRILEGEQPKGTGSAIMAKSTPFAKERAYPTILDALKTGRLDARTVNAVDALSVYGDRHATVAATKLLATELKNTDLGKYGTQDGHPDGWVEMAPGQRALQAREQSFYVPKEVADAMRPLFEQGLAGTKLAPLLKSQGYVKGLELGLSLFHVKALGITAFNNMGLTEFTKAMASDLKSPEFASAEREWAADGLTTAKTQTPYEAYEGLSKSSIPTGFDKLANAPVVKQVDAAFKATTEFTFDVVQRKFKVMDASLKEAAWRSKHPEATNEEIFATRRSIAKEVNSAYGGLNWDVLGTGKTVRDVSRLFLLAPDWTFSNVLTGKYAFEGGPAGAAARMFWAKSFATGIAMTAAMSIAIGGKYDPSDTKNMDRVYLGTDEHGKEMYADWFFAGAPKDAMTLAKRVASDSPIAGTAEFVVSKAAPLLGAGMGLAFNKDETGRPIYKRSDSGPKKAEKQGEYAAGRVVPITGVSAVETVTQALTDPDHEYSYRDLLELAADSMGSPTIHEGASGGASTKPQTLPGMTKRSATKKFSIRR
jgi:hypothetical protein